MSVHHFITKCWSCLTTITQCRCSSPTKHVTWKLCTKCNREQHDQMLRAYEKLAELFEMRGHESLQDAARRAQHNADHAVSDAAQRFLSLPSDAKPEQRWTLILQIANGES